MEAQMTHDHHRYEEDPHHNAALHSGEGETEHNHHGEKKSVLKKVKDKAKKIKNTITKHGGHGHEDDEDEETVVDSDVHGGAPMVSEGDFISGTALPKQTGLKLGNESSPPPPLGDRQTPSVRNEVYDDVENVQVPMASDRHSPNIRNEVEDDEVMKNSAPSMEDPSYIPKIGKEEHYSSGVGDVGALEDPYIPSIRKEEYYCSSAGDDGRGEMGRLPVDAPMTTDLLDPLPASTGPIDPERRANIAEPVVKTGPLADLDKDPHAPGARTPPPPPPNYQTEVVDPTGQGGREAEVAPLIERLSNLSVGDKSESIPPIMGSHDHEFNPPESLQGKSSSSSVTSVIADKVVSAKNAVVSSLGYGTQQGQEPSKTTALGTVSQYGRSVAEKLKAAAGAGSRDGDGDGDGGVVKEESGKGGVPMSLQGYLAEKFTPGEEDKELSKVITDAIHRKKKEEQPQLQPEPVKESARIEAVCSDDKTAAGVVDRVKGAIGSWLGGRGQQQGYAAAAGEGLDKEEVSRLQESGN